MLDLHEGVLEEFADRATYGSWVIDKQAGEGRGLIIRDHSTSHSARTEARRIRRVMLGLAPPAQRQGCLVAGCLSKHQAGGLCNKHYKAVRRAAKRLQ